MIMSGGNPTGQVATPVVGFLSTWNQECGLATYARYLLSEYEPGSYVVLGEQTERSIIAPDEPFVERCWRRGSADFSKLEECISKRNVGLLHLNCHYSFFPHPAFSQFMRRLQQRGITCVVHLHNVYQVDQQIFGLVSTADRVVVHSPESRLEVIANGADPDRVIVLRHGVQVAEELDERAKQNLKLKLQMPVGERIVLTFGFIQPHKGMEGVIEAVARLRDRGVAARGYIAGKANEDDPYSREYVQELHRMAELLHVSDRVVFLDRFLSEAEVIEYLTAADLVIMNYRSQHFEASGACSLALGAGALVAASIAPPFIPFGDAVWHITSGYTAALSAEILLTNSKLRDTIKHAAKVYCKEYAWPKVVERVANIYAQLGFSLAIRKKEKPVESKVTVSSPRKPMRVLMQMRPNAFTQRGGDTVVMDQLAMGLKERGIEVVIDPEGKEQPAQFDLVHLFNFALAEHTKALAQRAKQANVPYVVTTLYEDTPAYRSQAIAQAMQLVNYVDRGQNASWWEQHVIDVNKVKPAERFENSWTAENAAALFPNGSQEAKALKRDYPRCAALREVKLGHEIGAEGSPEAFEQVYAVKDFVLCVGRFEFRKNQLMLLKALEHSELTVVLASGGFSYDADYDRAVRSFKRRGKTIVIDRLSPQMLASAYAAAKVHVLPSWYELPGLVSLEAAHHGCAVVVTQLGTASDYFGQHAFYCDPWNESSICNAVTAAYYAPKNAELQRLARTYTWSQTIDQTLKAYEEIMVAQNKPSRSTVATVPVQEWSPPAATASHFDETLAQGETAAMSERWDDAHRLLDEALHQNPQSCRAHKAKGTVLLAQGQQRLARPYFERANALDVKDPRAISGIGMCELRDGNIEGAYQSFMRALMIDPKHLTSLLQFMECSYKLSRYQDLEQALRRYVAERPEDVEMQFCLAGVCFKIGYVSEAQRICEEVLKAKPQHVGAKELQTLLSKPSVNVASTPKIAERVTAGFAGTISPQGSNNVPNTGTAFDAEMFKLEELKRERHVKEALEGCRKVKVKASNAQERERAMTLEAECCVLTEDLPTAIDLYQQVLALNPQAARALCGKGALAAHSGRWEDARALFAEALQIRPEYDVALAGMGLCCSWFKQHEQAWDFYMRAVRVNPENARALLGIIELGYPLKRLSDVESAVRAYLEMHPLDFEFLYALAGCLYAEGKYYEASEEIKKITLFEPSNQRALELQRMIEQQGMSSAAPQTRALHA
jgi:glycosyltransferase involved in cell wall biosynthesis/Flp pilus assembly protein TadD